MRDAPAIVMPGGNAPIGEPSPLGDRIAPSPAEPTGFDRAFDLLRNGGFPVALLGDENAPKRFAVEAAKRVVDLTLATILLAFGSPVFLLAACAIKLTSRGSVLFSQTRIGLGGRPFKVYKFRTMIPDANPLYHEERTLEHIRLRTESGSAFKNSEDPRITPIGHLLRRSSVDELPQLLNVILGDMSIVGPRPCMPYEFEAYDLFHRIRTNVRPGITGLMQVCGRASLTFNEMIQLDVLYALRWNPMLDLWVLLKTPLAILRGTGAS